MFSAIYEGCPTPQAPDATEVRGASIVCWVRAKSKSEAAQRAHLAIEGRRWVIRAIESPWRQVSEKTVPIESIKYLEQAEIDGECYVFHSWDNSAEDDVAPH